MPLSPKTRKAINHWLELDPRNVSELSVAHRHGAALLAVLNVPEVSGRDLQMFIEEGSFRIYEPKPKKRKPPRPR